MIKILSNNWKDLVVIAALLVFGYYAYLHIAGWYQFRQVQVENTAIIKMYLQNDNPELLNKIVQRMSGVVPPPVKADGPKVPAQPPAEPNATGAAR